MPVILATTETVIRRIMVRGQPKQLVKLPNIEIRAGGVAQVIELLPSKHEA
jgi:hypothetical protein